MDDLLCFLHCLAARLTPILAKRLSEAAKYYLAVFFRYGGTPHTLLAENYFAKKILSGNGGYPLPLPPPLTESFSRTKGLKMMFS